MSNQPEDRVRVALVNLDQAFALALSAIKDSQFEEKEGVEHMLHQAYAKFGDEFGKLDYSYNIYGDHDTPIDSEISNFYQLMLKKHF